MSALTWITNKELEREIKPKGDEFRRKNHMIVGIYDISSINTCSTRFILDNLAVQEASNYCLCLLKVRLESTIKPKALCLPTCCLRSYCRSCWV